MTDVPADPSSIVVEAFRKVLARDDVALTTSFFRLGGNSMGMVMVIAFLKQRGLRITARQFMGDPTAVGVVEGVTPVAADE